MSVTSRRTRFLWLAAGLVLAAGCDQGTSPQFHLNMVAMTTNELDEQYQGEIANVLGAVFGTPDNPAVLPETGLDQTLLDIAAGPAWSSKEGASHGLYRRHCVHCHGITGDGRGPTAQFLNPYPRDYRKGVFKFKSTYNPQKPTEADLKHVLHEGVPGTSMPSFSLLPQAEVESLVEYVKYLAMRGELETSLINYVSQDISGEEEATDKDGKPIVDEDGKPVMRRIPFDPTADPDQAEEIKTLLEDIVTQWNDAKDNVINPEEDEIPKDDRSADEIADSIAKGRELFFGVKANCLKCHGPTALGDGQTTDFDVWAKEQNEFLAAIERDAASIARREEAPEDETDEDRQKREEKVERDRALLVPRQLVAETLLPVPNAIPRNLRKGVYRGGHRRIDIFWRVHAGIAGTPMPGIGATAPGGEGTLSDKEIWQIVDYVLSLPYEPPSGPEKALSPNLLENAR